MVYYENNVLKKIKSLLPQSFVVSTWFPSGIKTCDAIIYYKRDPIALIEIKKRLDNTSTKLGFIQMKEAAIFLNIKVLAVCTATQAQVISDKNYPNRKAQKMLIEHFVSSILMAYSVEEPISTEIAETLLDNMKQVALNSKIRNKEFLSFLNSLSRKCVINNASLTKKGSILLANDFENDLFRNLIGEFTEDDLCRYTSLHSTIRIVKEQKASLCGIVCMNDKSECYYADQYLANTTGERLLINMSGAEIKEINEYFIMSCSDIRMHDKLTMWRMYAGDATGTCITYRTNHIIKSNKQFFIAPVCYALENKKHPELDFIKTVLAEPICGYTVRLQNFDLWKHFFKPNDYADEHEIRLLYKETDTQRYKWIIAGDEILCPIIEFGIKKGKNEFPLTISSIMLGPKCTEKEANSAQLKHYISLQDIELDKDNIVVSVSNIDNYR